MISQGRQDAIALPPVQQTISSPQGQFILRLQAPADWQALQVTATLFAITRDRCQPVWTQTLPHEYGPRYALVTDQGTVVLLDEWINVASPHAITVLSAAGDPVARYSFDEVAAFLQAALGVSRADMVAQAAAGWWISAPPQIRRDGQTVQVNTGGDRLMINGVSGELGF